MTVVLLLNPGSEGDTDLGETWSFARSGLSGTLTLEMGQKKQGG